MIWPSCRITCSSRLPSASVSSVPTAILPACPY
jgi:hypothetical protein